MNTEAFQHYASSHGYKSYENMVLGDISGYPFHMIASGTSKKTNVIMSFPVSGKVDWRTIGDLKKALSSPRVASTSNKGNSVLGITIRLKDDAFHEDFEANLRNIVNAFRQIGINPVSECPICGSGSTNVFAWHVNAYLPAHRRCVEDNCQGTIAQMQDLQETGSYPRGIVGAFLGALVGTIPNFISIFFAEYIIGYLAALIPLASFWGYRLFKGKPGNASTIIILLCSLMQIFFLEQAVWYASLVKHLGIWPSVLDSINFYFYLFDSDSLSSIMQTAIFVCIGVFICFRYINSQTASNKISGTINILDTITERSRI